MVDVGLLAEQRRYARRAETFRDVGLEAERRRVKRVAAKRLPRARAERDVGLEAERRRYVRAVPTQREITTQREFLRWERAVSEWERTKGAAYRAAAFKRWDIQYYETYEKQRRFHELWQRDPYKALEYARAQGLITEHQYALEREALERHEKLTGLVTDINQLIEEQNKLATEMYEVGVGIYELRRDIWETLTYQPTWKEVAPSERLATWIDNVLRSIKEKPTGEMLKWAGGFEQFAYVPVGFVRGLEVTGLTFGTLIGDVEAAKVPRPPTLIPAHIQKFSQLLGFTHEAPEFHEYWKETQKRPGVLLGEVAYLWLEAKAMGWALGKTVSKTVRWVGRTRLGIKAKAKLLKTLQPPRVHPFKKVATLKYKLPEFVQRRFWPVEYGRRQIEKGIVWGEEVWMWIPDVELSETLSKTWKYTGYPVVYGKKAGYKILKAGEQLTAFQQIQKAIELGKFKGMGGLSAQQLLLFEKPTTMVGWEQARYLGLVYATAPAKAPAWMGPLFAGGFIASVKAATPRLAPPQLVKPKLEPIALEKFRPLILIKPKLREREKLIPVPKAFELERIKFRPLEFLEPKLKKKPRLAPAPKIAPAQAPKQPQIPWQPQMPKQIQKLEVPQLQVPKLVQPPFHWPPAPTPVPVPPIPPVPFKLPPELRLPREGGFWAGWFKRVHPIATPEQVMRTFGLTPPKRRVKRKTPKKRRRGRRR